MKTTPLTISCYNPVHCEHEQREVIAEPIGGLFPGFNFFVHTDPLDHSLWSVTEESSGHSVAGGTSREMAIEKAKAKLRQNRDRFPSIVREAIERNKQLFPQLNP